MFLNRFILFIYFMNDLYISNWRVADFKPDLFLFFCNVILSVDVNLRS